MSRKIAGQIGVELEPSEILGPKADYRLAEDLSRFFRDEVVRHAEVRYAVK